MIGKKSKIADLSPEDKQLWDKIKTHFTPLHNSKKNQPQLTEQDNLAIEEDITQKVYTSQTSNNTNGNISVVNNLLIEEKKISNSVFYDKSSTTTKIPNFDRLDLAKVKKDKIKIDRYLDLHNYTLAEAEKLFIEFIVNAHIKGYKLVLVITGKGISLNKTNTQSGFYSDIKETRQSMGVIKNSFFKWIEYEGIKKYIISYSQALPKDGGGGAFYLKIR